MAKMSGWIICASIIFSLFFGFGAQKLFHRQYSQWIIYFLSSGLFSLGNIVDVFEFLFDPDFLLLETSNKLVDKYRKIELIIKSILGLACLGIVSYIFFTWVYTVRNIYNVGVFIPLGVIVVGLFSNLIVILLRYCCYNTRSQVKPQQESELPESIDNLLNES